jgi:hypothetical protein
MRQTGQWQISHYRQTSPRDETLQLERIRYVPVLGLYCRTILFSWRDSDAGEDRYGYDKISANDLRSNYINKRVASRHYAGAPESGPLQLVNLIAAGLCHLS